MPVSQTRYDLLRSRLDRFTRMLPGVEARDVKAVHRTRVASRRIRELLPVLQLEAETATKLSRQLRKVGRRLGSVREADVMLLVIDELHESGRFHEPALLRMRDALEKAREVVRAKLPAKSAASELRRVARKLDRIARGLEGADTAQTRRAWRWALTARVTRRAAALRRAIDDAGSVYLSERIHTVRIAMKKLRYGLELDAEAQGLKSPADLRQLKRIQALLGRLHDLQVLVDRVRQRQASLAPPSVAVWRDLDTLIISLEQRCRRLHARYVGERQALIEICERCGAKGARPGTGSAKLQGERIAAVAARQSGK
jgi:CHAD domain-containing protein